MSKMSGVPTKNWQMPTMEDRDETFIFSVDTLDADMSFEAEEPELLDDDDIRLLTSLDGGLDSDTD